MATSQAQTPKKIIKKADKAFFNDESDKALALYEQALASNPDNIRVNYRLGLLYLQFKQPHKAIPVLQKATKLSPKYNPEYTLNLAQAYQLNGNFEEAINQYQAALANTSKRKELEIEGLNKKITECVSGQHLRSLPTTAEVRMLPGELNSAASDHAPILFNNDRSLLFTSSRQAKPAKRPDENIYVSEFDGQNWSIPKAFSKPVNTSGHDAAAGISADGNTLYIYRYENGGDIYQLKRTGTTWGEPEEMPEPINSEFYEPSIFITADNQFAFFASDRYDSFGGLDLYITLRQPDGSWSEAMNLGPNINTEYDEDAPFVSPDGLTLYFSSRGHNSMGGYDIFSSNSEGATWTKARNLGFPVNSPFDDIYLVTIANGNQGFFSSDRVGGAGDKDLYGVTFRSAVATDSLIAATEPETVKDTLVATARPDTQTIMLRGKVTEAGLGAPLAAQLVLTEVSQNQNPIYANADSLSGGYQFVVDKGKKYNLVARKEGYFYATENLNFPENFLDDTVAKNFALKKIKTGAKLVLNNLFFEYNSDQLTMSSRDELNRLYDLMVDNSGLSVEISGHTDSRGSAAYNQALSLKRAKAVVNYLNEKGISEARLKAVGYGAQKPIATNKTEKGRKQNRRTEFKVLQK
ncbi:OmpA family protein [Adhaeribacter sp. BT258]|uniref:OmpA family protein n=1 Tax=Adhaeribacter terrigena TaxID=2793070 RepID=A0ABS1BY62_9BACT|nr:OmpA family protein [Adhaeribacter terrigena]MBK0402100.1 OmpA family protein [Adhaeribacter terrigena]